MTAAREDKPQLADFLAGQDEATKAKYAAELENAGDEWRKPLDFWYAESLVYFGELERNTETLYTDSGMHIRGSRTTFRKNTTAKTPFSQQKQQSLFAESFA